MAYVSCRYAPPPPENGPPGPQMAICTDEAGAEWWLDPETCDVGDFRDFIAAGGEIEPYEPPEEEPDAPTGD